MIDYRVSRGESREDQFTAAIEKSTSKIPSSGFLAFAFGAMAASFALQAWNKKHAALFVGQWAAPLLIFGIYNKLVKQHGSDGSSERIFGSGARTHSNPESFRTPEESYSHQV